MHCASFPAWYFTGVSTANTACCICGGGQRDIPFDNNVVDGVMDLDLSPFPAIGTSREVLEFTALNILDQLFHVDRIDELFDNVHLCIPTGSFDPDNGRDNWIAYARIGGYVSVYNGDFMCGNEVTQLHETGHNWGLR